MISFLLIFPVAALLSVWQVFSVDNHFSFLLSTAAFNVNSQVSRHSQSITPLIKDSLLRATTVSDIDNDERSNQRVQSGMLTSTKVSSSEKTGLGEWEEMHGNYLLRPPKSESPRALIHFIGGAIVGAAPDIFYRYLLEKLAGKGFIVVATPYQLSFDYLETCDDIISKFERIAPDLARQFGPLPVIGVGHSCGALLQLLITSLFPDTPRAANALISFNNKPVTDAVPFFDEIVAPFFVTIAMKNATFPNAVDFLNYSIRVSRDLAEGKMPSDDLLTDVARLLVPRPFLSEIPEIIKIPEQLRSSIQQMISPLSIGKKELGLHPIVDQCFDVLEQIPSLIQEVSDGARDFIPPPNSVKTAARRAYRARRTLIIQYDEDSFDESEELEKLLIEAESLFRMKRPMVTFDVKRITLSGVHATPCIAPPLDLATRAEDILGSDNSRTTFLYSGADATVEGIINWLEEGQL